MTKVRYSVVLDRDDEAELFVASVPALAISTYGETRQEALEKVREAILVTIEGLQAAGQPVPEGDGEKVELVEVTV